MIPLKVTVVDLTGSGVGVGIRRLELVVYVLVGDFIIVEGGARLQLRLLLILLQVRLDLAFASARVAQLDGTQSHRRLGEANAIRGLLAFELLHLKGWHGF